jgi:hypothetical protein
MSNNQYMYVRDVRCPERVLTIVTKIEPNTGIVKVACSINRVVKEIINYSSTNDAKVTEVITKVYDLFDRQHGKRIVDARLEKINEEGKSAKNYTFTNNSDTPMKVFVLEQLSKIPRNEHTKPHIRTLAKQKLAEMDLRKKEKNKTKQV